MNEEIMMTYYAEYRGHEGDSISCIVYLDGSKDNKSNKLKADLKLDTNNSILMKKVETLKFRDKFYIDVIYPKRGGYYNEKTWTVRDILDEYDMIERKNVNCLFEAPIIVKKTSFFQPKRMSKNYSAKDIEILELKEKNTELKGEVKASDATIKYLNEKITKLEKENEMLTEQLNNFKGGVFQ